MWHLGQVIGKNLSLIPMSSSAVTYRIAGERMSSPTPTHFQAML
jgi:hypothetical protein